MSVRCYISGKMRGEPNFGFDAFDLAAKQIEGEWGWEVVNPAAHDREVYPNIEQWEGFATGDSSLCPEFDLHAALRWDLRQITECDALVLLPGWESSEGAYIEKFVAAACGLAIYLWGDE